MVPEGTMTAMSEYMDCSDKFLYCWCKNERGLEIPGTRRYQGDPTFLQVDCEQQVQLYLDTTTVAANNIDITGEMLQCNRLRGGGIAIFQVMTTVTAWSGFLFEIFSMTAASCNHSYGLQACLITFGIYYKNFNMRNHCF